MCFNGNPLYVKRAAKELGFRALPFLQGQTHSSNTSLADGNQCDECVLPYLMFCIFWNTHESPI